MCVQWTTLFPLSSSLHDWLLSNSICVSISLPVYQHLLNRHIMVRFHHPTKLWEEGWPRMRQQRLILELHKHGLVSHCISSISILLLLIHFHVVLLCLKHTELLMPSYITNLWTLKQRAPLEIYLWMIHLFLHAPIIFLINKHFLPMSTEFSITLFFAVLLFNMWCAHVYTNCFIH